MTVDEGEELAMRLFQTDCMVMGQDINMGRSAPEMPRGYKTEAARWLALAREAIKTLRAWGSDSIMGARVAPVGDRDEPQAEGTEVH